MHWSPQKRESNLMKKQMLINWERTAVQLTLSTEPAVAPELLTRSSTTHPGGNQFVSMTVSDDLLFARAGVTGCWLPLLLGLVRVSPAVVWVLGPKNDPFWRRGSSLLGTCESVPENWAGVADIAWKFWLWKNVLFHSTSRFGEKKGFNNGSSPFSIK